MSVSVNIVAKRKVSIFDTNITYNLAPIYYKAIDEELGFKKLKGMTCKKALPIINNAIKNMLDNKEEYLKLNPENGWGSYDGLLEEFKKMKECCENNSDGIFEMDI